MIRAVCLNLDLTELGWPGAYVFLILMTGDQNPEQTQVEFRKIILSTTVENYSAPCVWKLGLTASTVATYNNA